MTNLTAAEVTKYHSMGWMTDEEAGIARFEVIDNRTKQVVGTFKNKQAARSKRDRMDLAYGAVRYSVRVAA